MLLNSEKLRTCLVTRLKCVTLRNETMISLETQHLQTAGQTTHDVTWTLSVSFLQSINNNNVVKLLIYNQPQDPISNAVRNEQNKALQQSHRTI